jgi:hypothetical protein
MQLVACLGLEMQVELNMFPALLVTAPELSWSGEITLTLFLFCSDGPQDE